MNQQHTLQVLRGNERRKRVPVGDNKWVLVRFTFMRLPKLNTHVYDIFSIVGNARVLVY